MSYQIIEVNEWMTGNKLLFSSFFQLQQNFLVLWGLKMEKWKCWLDINHCLTASHISHFVYINHLEWIFAFRMNNFTKINYFIYIYEIKNWKTEIYKLEMKWSIRFMESMKKEKCNQWIGNGEVLSLSWRKFLKNMGRLCRDTIHFLFLKIWNFIYLCYGMDMQIKLKLCY